MPHPLPMTTAELVARGHLVDIARFDADASYLDVVIVTGDAYVDHPSFGAAVIGRVLEAAGFSVGIISQPEIGDPSSVRVLGRPRLFFGITSGTIDSMLHHYTAARRVRNDDPYTPGGKAGRRPDRAVIAYTSLVRSAYKGARVVLGGMEASMRRAAHYDYWSDSVRRSILVDAKADVLLYGMAEGSVRALATALRDTGEIPGDLAGAVLFAGGPQEPDGLRLPSFEEVRADPVAFNRALVTVWEQAVPGRGRPLYQDQGGRTVRINPPAPPLAPGQLDDVYALPFTRRPHPAHGAPVPALETVRWSVVTHRGCYGGCRFCSIALHQGHEIVSRSAGAILDEVRILAADPAFGGTITDLGGPSANMYGTFCKVGGRARGCRRESCLVPEICPSLVTDQGPTLRLWDAVTAIPRVKHCFVASGVRYDLALLDDTYLRRLVQERTGGHLKVAPEHVSAPVTEAMHKPPKAVFLKFLRRFAAVRRKGQYLVPYMISSHPGCDLGHMAELERFMGEHELKLEQAQDFIPLPMTFSGAMYFTGLNPLTGAPVFVERSREGKLRQRSLLAPKPSEHRPLGRKARSASPGRPAPGRHRRR